MSFSGTFNLVLRPILSQVWPALSKPGWPSSKSQGSFYLHLSTPRITTRHCIFFTWVLGTEVRAVWFQATFSVSILQKLLIYVLAVEAWFAETDYSHPLPFFFLKNYDVFTDILELLVNSRNQSLAMIIYCKHLLSVFHLWNVFIMFLE